MRIIFLITFFLLASSTIIAQTRKVYGRDFDYKTLLVIDTLSPNALPNYYVCCNYQNGVLTDIDIFQKADWMNKYLQTHSTVILKNGYTFFVYDAGKAKTGGYGRLFSKKTKFSDTAMLINDTLIYKTTRFGTSSVLVKYITSIFSDSITVHDKVFALGSRKLLQTSALASFENYLQWNELTTYSRYYQRTITPKADDIVKAKRILDPYADYTYSGRHTREYFKLEKMPPSVFWIKHSGIIY